MLRVTDRMGSLTTSLNLAKNRYLNEVRQQEATTGLRVSRASDDPSGASTVINNDADQAAVEQSRDNLAVGIAELSAADTALDQASELLIKAKEIALSMANGNISASERKAAAIQISQLRSELIALGNTKHNGKYIFSGYETSTAAFTSAGVYAGDTNARQIWATPTMKLQASVTGSEAFTAAGGIDIIAALQTLSTALSANNLTGIAQGLDTMTNGQQQVLSARTKAGLYAGRMIELDSMLQDRKLDLSRNRANIADADITETLSELARAQQALNTTVQVSARVLASLTLVDKL